MVKINKQRPDPFCINPRSQEHSGIYRWKFDRFSDHPKMKTTEPNQRLQKMRFRELWFPDVFGAFKKDQSLSEPAPLFP